MREHNYKIGLFVLASVIIIGQVHSYNIAYPVEGSTSSLIQQYGDLPSKGTIVQGFIHYLDNNGIERVISYSYPKPMAISQTQTYITTQGVPFLQSHLQPHRQIEQQSYQQQQQQQQQQQINSIIWERAREAHFRAWSWQQYQALKREIDILLSQGIQPSTDMLDKYQLLEKIALTKELNLIADIPDVKRMRNEHLNVWQQGITKSQMNPSIDQHQQQNSNAQTHAHAHVYEEHLQIHNKQIEQLKQMEKKGVDEHSYENMIQHDKTKSAEQSDVVQEHLRIWNAANINVESDDKSNQIQKNSVNIQFDEQHQQQDNLNNLHSQSKISGQESAIQNEIYLESFVQQQQQQQQQQIEHQLKNQDQTINDDNIQQYAFHLTDTPEVQRAREEHLKIFSQIKAHVERRNKYEQEQGQEQNRDHNQDEYQDQEQEQKQKQHAEQHEQQQQMLGIRIGETDQITDGIDLMTLNANNENIERLKESERKQAEENFLQMENLREAQRLQEQQKQLEVEKQQEVKRLIEEKRQMKNELMRLHLEETRRLQIERLQEVNRLKQENEQIKNQQQQPQQQQQQQQQLQQEQYKLNQQIGQHQQNIDKTFKSIPFVAEEQRPIENADAISIPTFTTTFAPTSYIQESYTLPRIHASNTASATPATAAANAAVAALYPATFSYRKSLKNIEPNHYGIIAGQQPKLTYYILPIPAASVDGTSGSISVGTPVQYVPFIKQDKSFIPSITPLSSSSLPAALASTSASVTGTVIPTFASTFITKATKIEPIVKDHAQSAMKDLDALSKARREHFEAYNMALRQLAANTANINSPININARSDTILPCN